MVSYFPPGAVPNWMHKLKNGAYISNKILERSLHSLMTEDEACQAVENAIKVGILVPKKKSVRARAKQFSVGFCKKFYELERPPSNDPYCFECHLGGIEPLKNCLMCSRSFHVACQRKNPHRPNYSVPSDKGQTYRFPLNESDMEESNDEEVAQNGVTTQVTTGATIDQDANYELDCNSNINIGTCDTFKREADSSDDVFFVSEQPARQSKRCSEYIKSEETSQNESNNEMDFCTPCRLMKLAELLNPPHMSTEELNCLLGYSWQKHRSWITKDIRKYMAKHWNDHDSDFVKKTLFKNELLGAADIAHNIEIKKLKHLSEFLIDLLDLQHNIGIFFGTKCEEYNATKWLLRDITHDVREIARCSDCYRHSNESNRSTLWFAKPCTQRHELVYAKQHGSRHWPAKVIRVLTKKNSIYDVRFFGGSHSRALISARDILAIDADVAHLNTKIKLSRSYNAAMRELRCHMLLLHQPMYLFNFYADPRETENLINRALSHCMEAAEVNASIKRPRAATPASIKKRRTIGVIPSVSTVSTSQRLEAHQDITHTLHMATHGLPSPTFEASGIGYRDLTNEVILLNDQLTGAKAELDMMREELIAVKRKKWCQHCMKEAEFDCCFLASYCSVLCKRRHKRRHQATCTLQKKT